MRSRKLSDDFGQDSPGIDDKTSRDLVGERFVDSLVSTKFYHSAEGVLDVDRLIRDVRAIQNALAAWKSTTWPSRQAEAASNVHPC
jgi:hypothetical protein